MMRKLISAMVAVATATASAQQLPPIRQIGRLERVSADSVTLKSVQNAIAMPGGGVMINDGIGRRVLLLDSTLSRAVVVADTSAATANAYGRNPATLIRFYGDSALLIVVSTLSMFVIAPNGGIARTMAVTRPGDIGQPNDVWINPAVDASGRIVYLGSVNVLPGMSTIALGAQLYEDGKPTAATAYTEKMFRPTDSAAVVRADPATRSLDTIAWIRIPKFRRRYKADADGRASAVESVPDPLPVLDLTTMLGDGTMAVVRGVDFHIDWIDRAGKMTSSPKIPFEWKKIDEARKHELIDSTVKKWQALYDEMLAPRPGAPRGGRGGIQLAPQVVVSADPADVAGYAPPFSDHAVASGADDNVWIQTTTLADNRPIYDIVNRRGELIDRVQVPAFRSVAGFGSGVIYMAVETPDGKVRLERARIH